MAAAFSAAAFSLAAAFSAAAASFSAALRAASSSASFARWASSSTIALAVLLVELGAVDQRVDRGLGGLAHQGLRREDAGALDNRGDAVLVEEADKGFADGQLGQSGLGVELFVHAEGLRRGADGLLLGRRIRAQRVLDAVGELGQNVVGDVGGALRDEIDTDALGADQLDDLDDLLHERLGRVVEEQMRLVKEEDHARLVGIADLGQLLVKLGHHPQQEGGVDQRARDQALAGEDVDEAAAGGVDAHPVVDVETRLAEELVAALVLKGEERALDRADAGGGDVAVLGGELGAVVADVLEHRAQVLEIEQQQAVVVGHAENDVQNAGLDLGQAEETSQERRAHLGDGDADRVALLAENVPEAGGIGFEGKVLDPEALDASGKVVVHHAGHAHAGEVSLDVAEEHRNAHVGEGLGHHLHRDGLAGAGRAGDDAVAVGHLRQDEKVLIGLCHPYLVISKHSDPPYLLFC